MLNIDAQRGWPHNNSLCVLIIYVCSFVFLFVLIANPGYFSHDELQRYDYYVRHGFLEYLRAHLQIHVGSGFGTPVRPFSFLLQGLQNFFIRDYPIFVHLSAVIVTATVASFLYFVMIRFGFSKRISLIAALIFLINPLSILATGWSAALMDQWYVLFGLLGLLAARKYVHDDQASAFYLFLIFVLSVLSILSKETAIMLPALLFAFVLYDVNMLRNKRLFLIAAAWTIPIIIYVSYRFPAIATSFELESTAPYSASLANVFRNISAYFVYPFLPKLTEAHTWIYHSDLAIGFSFAYHLLIVYIIWRLYSIKFAIGYLFAYFILLLPVLLIPAQGSNYLYSSSLFLSVALACIIGNNHPIPYRVAGFVGLIILVFHSFYFQLAIYRDGVCMDRLTDSLESLYLSNGRPKQIEFTYDDSSPAHVLHRFVTGRDQIGVYYPVSMSLQRTSMGPDRDALHVRMNSDCIAFVR